MDELEFVETSDGSYTLRNRVLNETYHSVHGAVQESAHVFIKHGLKHFCDAQHPAAVCVLEVGFGTGLNAWLALQYAIRTSIPVHYTTLEPFALGEAVWLRLNYATDDRSLFDALHQAAWNTPVVVHPAFTLQKLSTSLSDFASDDFFDVVFFDAFAPSVQPELWSHAMLQKVTQRLHPGGVFVTYSARGQVKRDLTALGLQVETLPGPPGKKEMVRGRR